MLVQRVIGPEQYCCGVKPLYNSKSSVWCKNTLDWIPLKIYTLGCYTFENPACTICRYFPICFVSWCIIRNHFFLLTEEFYRTKQWLAKPSHPVCTWRAIAHSPQKAAHPCWEVFPAWHRTGASTAASRVSNTCSPGGWCFPGGP